MTLLDQKIAALFRKSSPFSADAETSPSLNRSTVEQPTPETVVSETAVEVIATRIEDQPTQGITAEQTGSLWTGLDLDTAIRLRWALRDIKSKRTKLTPVSPGDLQTLIEMGLIEMRGDAPMLNKEAHQALDR